MKEECLRRFSLFCFALRNGVRNDEITDVHFDEDTNKITATGYMTYMEHVCASKAEFRYVKFHLKDICFPKRGKTRIPTKEELS